MGIHRLQDENSAIRISYRGLPPIPVTSWLLAVFLLLFTGVVAALAYQGLAPKLSDDWYLRFDWWWRVVLYMMIFVGPAALISAFVLRWTPFSVDYVKHAHWDPGGTSLSVMRARFCGLLSKRSDFDLSGLREIEAFIGEDCGDPIEFELCFCFDSKPDVSLELQINDVDHRSEVLDVVFSIARHCRLSHYTIEKNEAETLVIRAGLDGDQSIPTARQAARYDIDETSTLVRPPSPTVAALDPSAYSDWIIKLDQWQPDRQVRFHRPAAEMSVIIFVGGGCGLVAGVIGAFLGAEAEGSLRVGLPVVAACGVAVVAMIVYRFKNLEYEVLIDHGSGRIDWRSGWRSHSRQLSQAKRVVLRGFEQQVKQKNRASYTLYRCGLFIEFDQGTHVLLTENDSWERSRDEPRRALEPLAAAISQAVNLSWSWRAYQPPPIARFVQGLVHFMVLLLLIGVMGFFAWGTWRQGKFHAEYDALADELEARGAVVTQAGVNVGNVSIFGDGFMVEVHDSEFGDEDLRELLQGFDKLQIPQLLALDLSGTRITDQGVETMAGYSALYLVNLQGTNVTAKAIEILANSSCSSIDVRDTPIRIEDLKPYDGVYSLKVLMISDEDVSDADLWMLNEIPYLDAVLINDAEQTRLAFDRLSENSMPSDLQIAGEVHYRLD